MIYFTRGLYKDYNGFVTRGLYIGDVNEDLKFELPFLKITNNMGKGSAERKWVGDDNKIHAFFAYRASDSKDIKKLGCSYFKLFSVQKSL